MHGYRMRIRDTQTGEEREGSMSFPLAHELSASDFLWLEGNMACDCNRWLEYQRAGGVEPKPGQSYPCCGPGPGRFVYAWVQLERAGAEPVRFIVEDEAVR